MKKTRKTTHEERIQIAKECIETGNNNGEIALKHNVSYQQVRAWTKRYAELGEAGLEDRRGKRTASQQARTVEEELKIKLAKLCKEKDVERFRNLRKSIIYEIFAPDTIMERNICYRNEIKEWCIAMQDELVPNLDNFSEEEVNKILAILAFEKNRIEGKREYEELINNLLIFMDSERRRM